MATTQIDGFAHMLFFCPHLDLNHLDSLQNMTLVHYLFAIILIEPDKQEVVTKYIGGLGKTHIRQRVENETLQRYKVLHTNESFKGPVN